MNGQAAMEYLLLIGLLFVVLTPVFLLSLNSTAVAIRFTEAKEAVEAIAAAADHLDQLGGGKQTIVVTIPAGVTSTKVGNQAIVVTVAVGGAAGDSVAFTDANVTGSIPAAPGRQEITLEVVGNAVQLS